MRVRSGQGQDAARADQDATSAGLGVSRTLINSVMFVILTFGAEMISRLEFLSGQILIGPSTVWAAELEEDSRGDE